MLWTEFCPDGAKNDVVGNVEATLRRSDGFSATPLLAFRNCSPLAQRGLIDEVCSTAHSTSHQCAFCFGMQKSAPKPKKPWTSQRTAAMSVWTGTARHQLHKHRFTLKRADKKRVLVAVDLTWAVYAKQRENVSCKKERHAEGPEGSHEAGDLTAWMEKTRFRSE